MYAKQAAHTLAGQCERFDRAALYINTSLVQSLFEGRDWLPVLPLFNRCHSIHLQPKPPRPSATFPKQSIHGLPFTTRSSPCPPPPTSTNCKLPTAGACQQRPLNAGARTAPDQSTSSCLAKSSIACATSKPMKTSAWCHRLPSSERQRGCLIRRRLRCDTASQHLYLPAPPFWWPNLFFMTARVTKPVR